MYYFISLRSNAFYWHFFGIMNKEPSVYIRKLSSGRNSFGYEESSFTHTAPLAHAQIVFLAIREKVNCALCWCTREGV